MRVRRTLWVSCGVAALALLALAAYALKLFEPLPLHAAASSSRLVLDRDGQLLRAFTTPDGRWRLDAKPEDVSPTYLSLLMTFEDRRFWKHQGVDPVAMGRAVVQAVRHGRLVSGGSTLTMQVARLLRGSPTHSLPAKFQQIADAARLEATLSKREILSLYLKLAPYGGNLEGVRAASLAYFGKEPNRLSIAEAAVLVAIPQSPERRRLDRGIDEAGTAADEKTPSSCPSPQGEKERQNYPQQCFERPLSPRGERQSEGGLDRRYRSLLEARNRVILRAAAAHVITQADAKTAIAQAAPRGRREFPAFAPHLSDRLTSAAPSEAAIQTTIDGRLQEAAEQITRRNAQAFGEKVSVAALVVGNRTGEVLAHVGSAGYFDETRLGAIDMTAAVRSPGSALKPFIYGLAFEDGLAHPETLIEDKPVRFDTYAPANFDSAFHGTVTVRTALQLSLNVPAVKVLNEVGPVKLAARIRDAGMPFPVPRNLTVALGGVGLSLENLTGLYLALARGGSVIPIRYQKDGPGPVWNAPDTPVLLQPAAAWYVTDILRGAPVPASATPGAIAFKTGTSYGFRDAWAAGFDGDYTIAVWVGRADATSVPGLVGLRVAAPVLFELFGAIGPHRAPFAGAPANVIGVRKTQDLPPPLRAFHEQKRDMTAGLGHEAPLRIAYPPANAEVELATAEGEAEKLPVALKAEGGKLPLTWLADGMPLQSSPYRRDAFLKPTGPGFVQITVVDSEGRSDRTQIRLR
jgi:penicillin-binding protein 1C